MRLVLIDAGGTISAVDHGGGFEGGRLPDETLAAPRAVVPDLELDVRTVYQGLSEAMAMDDAMAVVRAIAEAASEPDLDGILVAHGTDAMEETAFLATLTTQIDLPVVFTGAQHTPSDADYDGLDNLTLAVRAIAEGKARGTGPLIAFGGKLLTAWRARKVHAQALQAFGPEDADLAEAKAAARARIPCQRPSEDVEIIALGLGASGRMVRAAARSGVRGLILQAMGCGNASDDVVAAVRDALEAGCLVGVATSCFEGEAIPFYASGRRLEDAGAVFMKELDPRRARVVMACALGDGRTPEQAHAILKDWL